MGQFVNRNGYFKYFRDDELEGLQPGDKIISKEEFVKHVVPKEYHQVFLNTPESDSVPIWVSVKELFKTLKEYPVWSLDTKYLHIYIDTRFIDGDYYCTIRTRDNDRYLTLNDIKTLRQELNKERSC